MIFLIFNSQFIKSDSYRILMRIQMLAGCHFLYSRANNAYSFRLNFLESNLTYKAIKADTAISLVIAIGGQRMASARSIISCTFRRQRAQKYRTGINHPLRNGHIIRCFDNEMLRCIGIGQFDSFVHIAHNNQFTIG